MGDVKINWKFFTQSILQILENTSHIIEGVTTFIRYPSVCDTQEPFHMDIFRQEQKSPSTPLHSLLHTQQQYHILTRPQC